MTKSYHEPKVALVYDRANTAYGGAERLLKALAKKFHPVDLFTTVVGQVGWLKEFDQVNPSFINRLPFAKTHHQFYEPLAPLAFESFNLDAYDVIISVSSGQSKAILTKPHQLHLNYLLTPPRYIYQYQDAYQGKQPSFKDEALKLLSAPARAYLKWFDQTSIFRPDIIVPLSQVVRRRALTVYPQVKIEAPIYPFALDLTKKLKKAQTNYPHLTATLKKIKFNLSVSRLVKYKRVDLSIKASLKLNQPLIVVGEGVEFAHLVQLAGNQGAVFYPQPDSANTSSLHQWFETQIKKGKLVFFLGKVDDLSLSLLYHLAQVVIAPGVEDFGLVPLEAAFFLTPSIIHQASGVAEVLTEAVKLKHQSVAELATQLKTQAYKQLNRQKIKSIAARQTQKSYLKKISALVYDRWQAQKVSYKV